MTNELTDEDVLFDENDNAHVEQVNKFALRVVREMMREENWRVAVVAVREQGCKVRTFANIDEFLRSDEVDVQKMNAVLATVGPNHVIVYVIKDGEESCLVLERS